MNSEIIVDILFLNNGEVIRIEQTLEKLLSDYKVPEYF